jgi:hypothetical protein
MRKMQQAVVKGSDGLASSEKTTVPWYYLTMVMGFLYGIELLCGSCKCRLVPINLIQLL